MQFNNTDADVNETLTVGRDDNDDPVEVELNIDGDVKFRVYGQNVKLEVEGQTLEGSFAFSKSETLDALGNPIRSVIKIAATDVSLGLGDGTTDYVSVTNGQGAFIVSSNFGLDPETQRPISGMVGSLSGDVDLNLPGVELTGNLAVKFSNVATDVNETVAITNSAGVEVNIPVVVAKGPFLSVEVTGTTDLDGDTALEAGLIIAGQTLHVEKITLEQLTAANGTKRVRLLVENIGIILTQDTPSGPDEIFRLDFAQAALLVTPQGIAGELRTCTVADIASDSCVSPFAPNGLELAQDITLDVDYVTLQINNLPVAVKETFDGVNGPVVLDLPAGPFVRAEMVGATLNVGPVALSGSFAFEQAEQVRAGDTTKITKIGLSGVSLTIDGQDLVKVSGALILVPTGYKRDGAPAAEAASTTGGLAGELRAQVGVATDGFEVGGIVNVQVNTSGVTVEETITVGETEIIVNVGAIESGFLVEVGASFGLDIGDFVRIEGSVLFGSGGSFRGEGLLVFMGQGPFYGDDGERNPDAIGVLLSNASVNVIKGGTSATPTYVVYATGDVEFIGLDGLVVEATATIKYNSTTDNYAAVGTQLVLNGGGLTQIAAGIAQFKAENLKIALGGYVQIDGTVTFTRKPSGGVDVAIANGSIQANVKGLGFDTGVDRSDIIRVSGYANFSIGGAEGFRLQSFRANDFSLFDGGDTGPVGGDRPTFQPTADLNKPFTGEVITLSDFNLLGVIEVKFNDPNEVGLLATSITDTTAEFDVLINGQVAPGFTVNGVPTLKIGTTNVYRYTFTGAIAVVGELSIAFRSNAFQDNQGNTNTAEIEYISLVNRNAAGELPLPAPVGKLASPVNGSSISVGELSGQMYIDVTYVSRDGSPINLATIDGNEFTLTGTAVNKVKLLPGTGGIPDIAGQPLQVGADTFRYFLKLDKVNAPPGILGQDDDGNGKIDDFGEREKLFKAGELEVRFRAGSFQTEGGALSVARTETITVEANPAGQTSQSGAINLGPLTLQGPSIGLADFGFKDGLVMLSIAVGVERASLAFGGSQGSSGITADLIGVVGTFDIGVDVLGLFSGNFRVEVPGKWSLNVASLEVDIPDLLQVTAEGIRIGYDPEADNTQELVRIDEANIFLPKFAVRGTIRSFDPDPNMPDVPAVDANGVPATAAQLANNAKPGLIVRGNGFSIGNAELCLGCEGVDASSTMQNTDANGNTVATTDIKFGSILTLDDIRFGVTNFNVTFGQTFAFTGSIYIASGGAELFPENDSLTIRLTDRDSAQDVRSDGSVDDEALRIEVEFDDDGGFKGFIFEVDTLLVSINDFVTITAVGFRLDTSATGTDPLVEFVSVGAKVKIGSLELGGEARNFAILGNGSFDARPGFGIFLSVGSASGSGFNWPSWLPIKIHALGVEWDDFDNAPEDFLITLSASITGLPAVAGLEFEGLIEGVKISPTLLLQGKFPIVDIASIGVSVSGKIFGGELDATLIGGILKFSESGAAIDQFDRTTPVADRVFFIGVEGGFKLAGLAGLTIQFAMSELGPLGVLISASVPGGILLEPTTGLSINDFTAGVEFFKTLPSITDPFELRNPEFEAPTDLSPDEWLASVKQQVVTQYNLVKANPAMSGFEAAFTSPMTITGGAKLFSLYLSKEAFNGEVMIKISTDGKFLISGKLNFAADNLSLSAKLYADLSNVATGDVTVLFLADLPDQARILTIHGKLQMGFGPSGGSLNVVSDAEEVTTVAIPPTAALIDPAAGMIDANTLNSPDHTFNGKNYIDVDFRAANGSSLDWASIEDAAAEFTLTANGRVVAVDGVPVPIITTVSADGMLTTEALVPNAGESMADAIRRTGTSRFRYTIEPGGSAAYQFGLGTVTVSFQADGFSTTSITLESGTVLEGVSNEASTLEFTVEGATATLLDPAADGGIDITAVNERGYLDVRFAPSAGATLSASDITDASNEFELTGAGAAGVTVNGAATLVDGNTFRYTFEGEFTTGVITAEFMAGRWMDDVHTNRAFNQTFEVRGATADVIAPTPGGTIGVDEINNLGYIEVRFQGTSDAAIDESTIDGDEIILRDSEGNLVAIAAIPSRVGESNIYRYAILDTLVVGAYEVEIVVGSFTDTALTPNANLVEIETFTVGQATATLADPLPGDVIDREALNERGYIDVEFIPVAGAEVDHGSITDDGQEFTLTGADGQNVGILGDAVHVEGNIFRYSFGGSFNSGELTLTFIERSWNDCRTVTDAGGTETCVDANQGTASSHVTDIITQSESFFIEISGGILLQSAGLFDEPLIEIAARARIEIDSTREVFSLDFSGELSIIKLGTVGATAGKFFLATGETPSGNPEFWGVMTVETNFSALEEYGIFLFAKGTLQINLTASEKRETLTLRGLGDNGEDLTREFVLPAASFALEVVGDASIRAPGTNTDLVSLGGAYYIGIDPTGFTIYATASLKFGSGDTAMTYGESTGLIIVKTGFVRETNPNTGVASFRFAPSEAGIGIAASFTVGSSAGLGIPGVGSIFSVAGSLNISLNTTLKDQSFDIPVAFHRLLEPGEPTTLNIFKSRPSLDGQERVGAPAEIYVVATIKAKLTFLNSFTLEGFVQLAVGISPSAGQATFALTGAVTGELGFLGAVSGTLNLTVFVGVKNGVVGRIQLARNTGLDDIFNIKGELVLEINAVASLGGGQFFNDEQVETFLIGDDGKFKRDANGNFLVGTVTIEPGVKLQVSGEVIIASVLELEGYFSFVISPTKFEVIIEATMSLDPFGSLAVSGGLRIDSNGLVLRASLTLNASFGRELGLKFSGGAYLGVNTSSQAQTINGHVVDSGLLVRIDGSVEFLGFLKASGFAEIKITSKSLEIEFGLAVVIGPIEFSITGAAGVFGGTDPGLAMRLAVSVKADVAVIEIEASGMIEFNSTNTKRLGVERKSFTLDVNGRVSLLKVLNFDAGFKVVVRDGAWRVDFNAGIDFFGLLTIDAYGFFDSGGNFDVTLEGGFRIGSSSFGLSGNAKFRVYNYVTDGADGNPHYSFGLSISASLKARLFGITLGGVGFNASFTASGSGRVKIELSLTVRIKVLFVTIKKSASFTVGYLQLPEKTYHGVKADGTAWTGVGSEAERELVLNVGSRSGGRNLAAEETAESYTLDQYEKDGDVYTRVVGLGRTNNYKNVHKIVADFGSGNDQIIITDQVTKAVDIKLGAGDDVITYQGTGAAAAGTVIDAGTGDDYVATTGNSGETIYLGDGDDTIELMNGYATVYGGNGNDTFIGSPANADNNPDRFFGEAGDDVFRLGGGDDLVNGGSGTDTVIVDASSGNDTVAVCSVTGYIDDDPNTPEPGTTCSLTKDGLVRVDVSGQGQKVATDEVERITIFTGAGSDNITVGDLTATHLAGLERGLLHIGLSGGLDPGLSGAVDSTETLLSTSSLNDNAADIVTVQTTDSDNDTFNVITGVYDQDEFVQIEHRKSSSDSGYWIVLAGADRSIDGDRLEIKAGGGNDNIDASEVVTDRIKLTLRGEGGDDTIVGSEFADVIDGGADNDTLTGGLGYDEFFDASGTDTLVETFADDVLLTNTHLIVGDIVEPGNTDGRLTVFDFYDAFSADDVTEETFDNIFEKAVLNGSATASILVVGDKDGIATIGGLERKVGTWTGDDAKNSDDYDITITNLGPDDITVNNLVGNNGLDIDVDDQGSGDTLIVFTTNSDDRLTIDDSTVIVGEPPAAEAIDMRDTINFGDVETLRLDTFAGIDRITVITTHAGQTTINAGRGNDQVAIRTISGRTLVQGGEGDDSVFVGSTAGLTVDQATADFVIPTGGVVEGIGADLTVRGNSSMTVAGEVNGEGDVLLVDNTANDVAHDRTGTLTSSDLSGFGMAGRVVYDSLENLTVNLGDNKDTLLIESTHGTALLTKTTNVHTGNGENNVPFDDVVNIRSIGGPSNVNTGTGKDLVNIGSLTGSADVADSKLDDPDPLLGFHHGFLTIDGGDDSSDAESLDKVVVYDSGATTGKTGILNEDGLTGLGIEENFGFVFKRFQAVEVRLGTQDDNLFIENTVSGTVTVLAGGGDDQINVEKTTGVTFLEGGAGDDTFNVNFDEFGDQTNLNGLGARLSLSGQDGSDSYNVGLTGIGSSEIDVIDDSGSDTGIDVLQILGTDDGDYFLLRANQSSASKRLGMVAAIEVDEDRNPRVGGGIERVNYDGDINGGLIIQGRDGDDNFVLDDNLAATTINGDAGNDSFQVGQVFASPRDETNPNNGLAPRDFFDTTAITRGYLSNGVSKSTTLTGGFGDDKFTVYRNLAEIYLFGNEDDDSFLIRAFVKVNPDDPDAPHTNVNGGQGADFIAFTVNAPVRVDGGDGFDTLTIVGTEFGDDFVVTDSGVFGAGLFVTFAGIEKLTVDALEGNDRFFIQSTSEKVAVEIIGGLGSDTFNVGGGEGGEYGEITVVSNSLGGHNGLIINTVTSADADYQNIFVQDLSVNVADNDEAGAVVDISGGSLLVFEHEDAAYTAAVAERVKNTYTVVLTRAPQEVVRITAAPVKLGEAFLATGAKGISLSTSGTRPSNDEAFAAGETGVTLVFDRTNWFIPQTVTIYASPDDVAEGSRSFTIQHTVNQGLNPDDGGAYDSLAILGVVVEVIDDDVQEVVVVETDAKTETSEGGSPLDDDNYFVVLTQAPDDTVEILIDTDRQPNTVAKITFTTDDWFQPKKVTVAARQDNDREGLHFTRLNHTLQFDDLGAFLNLSIDQIAAGLATAINKNIKTSFSATWSGSSLEISNTDNDATTDDSFSLEIEKPDGTQVSAGNSTLLLGLETINIDLGNDNGKYAILTDLHLGDTWRLILDTNTAGVGGAVGGTAGTQLAVSEFSFSIGSFYKAVDLSDIASGLADIVNTDPGGELAAASTGRNLVITSTEAFVATVTAPDGTVLNPGSSISAYDDATVTFTGVAEEGIAYELTIDNDRFRTVVLGGETDLTGVIQRLVAQVNYFGMHTAAEVVAGTSMSLKRTTDGAGFRVSLDRVTLAFEGNPETSESVGFFSGARSETEYLQATFTIAGNDTKVQEGDVWTVSVNDKILSYTAPVLNDATAISSVDVSITDDDAVGVHIIESDGSTDVAEPSNTVLIGTGVVNDGGQAQLTTVVRVLDVDLDTIDASFDSLITVATRDSTVEGKFTLEISFVNVDDHADRAWGINVKTAPGEFKIVEVSAAEINTKMMATTSLSKVEALAGLFRDKIDELITEPVVTADRVEFVGSFGVAETGESDAHATVFEAQDLDGSAWNRNASGNIEQAETLPHLTVNATHDGTADFYQFTITEKMFGDSGTISAIFDVDDGYEATVPWYPSIRLHKARFDASGRLDGSDVIVDGTSLPTSFPGAEALFAYRYDDDGSDNWEAYLERTFDQSSAIYGEGTYFIEIGDYSTQAGFAREFIDDYSLHVSIEGHEVDGFVFAQAPVTDTEAAVQQLEPDGDIGKNFFTFEDPTVGNTGLTTPGLVTSAAPYVRIEGSGDGSADVYEFTISEDQLTPTPIPITDETVVSSASNIFYTRSHALAHRKSRCRRHLDYRSSLQQHWFGFHRPAILHSCSRRHWC